MSNLNCVSIKYGTSRYKEDISILIIYTSYHNFEKKWWQDVLNIIARSQLIDWMFSYD